MICSWQPLCVYCSEEFMLEYDVKITDKELYDYMMVHSYNGAPGILGSCLGALMVVVALMNGHWIYLI